MSETASLALLVVVIVLVVVLLRQRAQVTRLQDEVLQAQMEVEGANNRVAQAQAQAALLSNTDPVTGLLVRQVVVERFQLALALARRHDAVFGIVLLQLTGFDHLVDKHGLELGNRLLAAVGVRLLGATRDSDTVARVREHEFAVLLPMLSAPDDSRAIVSKLRAALDPPITLPGVATTFRVAVHYGSAVFPRDGADWPAILKAADDSLGRSRIEALS